MDNRYTLGVDLGGQSIKLAVVDAHGTIRLRQQTAIDAQLSTDVLISQLIGTIRSFIAKARDADLPPVSVGVVMPGYMDRERTKLTFAANLPTLSGSTLLADIRAAIDLSVTFDADSNAAAFGEYRFGGGQGTDRLIVAAIGTGIGAGVILDGEVCRIRQHIAGSLGHIIVHPEGPRCACGARGCVEAIAAGPALEKHARILTEEDPTSLLAELQRARGQLTGREIAEALKADDEAAHAVAREAGRWLGVAIANWCVIFAPEKVLIGGGISAFGEPLIEAIRDGLTRVGQPAVTKDVVIDAAQLGPDAGVIGAAALATEAL